MKIRLDSARYEPFRWQETVAIPASDLDLPGVEAVAPVAVDGTLSFAEPNFWLEMRLAAVATVTCDRCLRQFDLPLAESAQWMVQQRSARPEPVERELGRDDLGLIEVSGDSFESAPLVREQIVLVLPAKPLCREDCAGLCPVCGGDRNLGECDCREPATDPRWEALSALRDKLDGRT